MTGTFHEAEPLEPSFALEDNSMKPRPGQDDRLPLILTELDAFWPKDETSAVFIAPWCFTGTGKKHILEYRQLQLVPAPWKDKKEILATCAKLDELLDRLVLSLKETFNQYYGVDYSQRFWSAALMPWLSYWIGNLHDHYARLENVAAAFPGQKFAVDILDPSRGKLGLKDFTQSVFALQMARYSLQVFSDIIDARQWMNLAPRKHQIDSVAFDGDPPAGRSDPPENVSSLKRLCLYFMYRGVFLGNIPGLTRVDRFRIILDCLWRKRKKGDFHKRPPKYDRIEDLGLDFSPRNAFEELASSLVLDYLPRRVLEGIPENRAHERPKYWIGNDIYRSQALQFKIARVIENGGSYIGVQHGCNYGQQLSFPTGKVEYELSRDFITWGWTHQHNHYQGRFTPLPFPRLSRHGYDFDRAKKHAILFVGTSNPMRNYGMRSQLPEDAFDYYSRKKVFLDHLDAETLKKTHYKPFPVHFGVNEDDYLKQWFSEDRIVWTHKGGALEVALESSLCLTDYPGTFLLEALAANVPIIGFFSLTTFACIKESERDLQWLIDANILFEDPVAAAKHVNDVHSHARSWWCSEQVQGARTEYCRKYARHCAAYLRQWRAFISSLP